VAYERSDGLYCVLYSMASPAPKEEVIGGNFTSTTRLTGPRPTNIDLRKRAARGSG